MCPAAEKVRTSLPVVIIASPPLKLHSTRTLDCTFHEVHCSQVSLQVLGGAEGFQADIAPLTCDLKIWKVWGHLEYTPG